LGIENFSGELSPVFKGPFLTKARISWMSNTKWERRLQKSLRQLSLFDEQRVERSQDKKTLHGKFEDQLEEKIRLKKSEKERLRTTTSSFLTTRP